jgi:O-methyltransferase
MNHGYCPESPIVKNENILMKYEASLYIKVLEGIETDNLRILDVGCGRGGGALTYNQYFKFNEICGCDINPISINFCKSLSDDINFKVSNACNLLYDDNSFDIVTNIESSHLYTDLNLFFNEVKRVLKNNGIFLIADVVDADQRLELFIEQNKIFDNFIKIDITKNVADACYNNINNFATNIKDTEVRDMLVDLMKEKAHVYQNQFHKYYYYIIKNHKEL